MSTLTYKGYLGSVEVSEEDECLHGRIEFIEDLVTFEGESYKELVQEFHAAVDDYLKTCSDVGKAPDKPFKGSFNVRIGPELHKRAAIAGRKNGQTLNDFVKEAVERRLDEKTVVKHEVLHRIEASAPDAFQPFHPPQARWKVFSEAVPSSSGILKSRAGGRRG